MNAEAPTLLQPRWPPMDDREMGRALELLARLTESRWVELDLRPAAGERCIRYRWGEVGDGGHRLSVPDDDGLSATFRFGSDRPPGPSLEPLASYLLRRLLTTRWLRHQATLMRCALDATASAVLLFDADGDIVYANPPADRLLSRQTERGLDVELPGEPPTPLFTFLCSIVEETARQTGAQRPWTGTLVLSDGTPIACEVLRVHPSPNEPGIGVLAILQPATASQQPGLHDLAVAHGLSPREKEVLGLLREGLTTLAIAERLGITAHTVRDHIKKLYRKTGTGSRGELLACTPSGRGERRRAQ